MKDLGKVFYILGIKIYKNKSNRLLNLFQFRYIYTVLKRFNMQDNKCEYLPMSHNIYLFKKMSPKISKKR